MIFNENYYDAMIEQVELDNAIFETCLASDFEETSLIKEGYEITLEASIKAAGKKIKDFIIDKLTKFKTFIVNKVFIPIQDSFQKLITNVKKSGLKHITFDSDKDFTIPKGKYLAKKETAELDSLLKDITDVLTTKSLTYAAIKDEKSYKEFMDKFKTDFKTKIGIDLNNTKDVRSKLEDDFFEEYNERKMDRNLYDDFLSIVDEGESTISDIRSLSKTFQGKADSLKKECIREIDQALKDDEKYEGAKLQLKAIQNIVSTLVSSCTSLISACASLLYKGYSKAVSVLVAYKKTKSSSKSTSKEESALLVEEGIEELMNDLEEACRSKKESDDNMDDSDDIDDSIEEGCKSKKEGCKSEGCGSKKEGCKSEGCKSKKEGCKSNNESTDTTDDSVEESSFIDFDDYLDDLF